jgi:hypothetical protein
MGSREPAALLEVLLPLLPDMPEHAPGQAGGAAGAGSSMAAPTQVPKNGEGNWPLGSGLRATKASAYLFLQPPLPFSSPHLQRHPETHPQPPPGPSYAPLAPASGCATRKLPARPSSSSPASNTPPPRTRTTAPWLILHWGSAGCCRGCSGARATKRWARVGAGGRGWAEAWVLRGALCFLSRLGCLAAAGGNQTQPNLTDSVFSFIQRCPTFCRETFLTRVSGRPPARTRSTCWASTGTSWRRRSSCWVRLPVFF